MLIAISSQNFELLAGGLVDRCFKRKQSNMPSSDASPTYRGYRRQALYVLKRILGDQQSQGLTFQPEGKEDLAIFSPEGFLLEIAQVKDYGQNLVLSDLHPNTKDSFFCRVSEELNKYPDATVNLVTFGPVGREMQHGLTSRGDDRESLVSKVVAHGLLSEASARAVIERMYLVRVTEAELLADINEKLGSLLTGVDPESAFGLLTYWLYRCSEDKRKITQTDLINQVNNVGKFLNERAAYHQEWFISIMPIEDREVGTAEKDKLANQFYKGISARYEHILADVDIPRYQRLEEMEHKFSDSNIVIVHAASGQGKTSLAYRYLHDYLPDWWRFQVRAIESRTQALRIATALRGHAEALGIPITVYVDATAAERDWPELVKELATYENVRVLVTVREEDWRRASISGAELEFSEVRLGLDRDEAEGIYKSLSTKQVPAEFVNFADAWTKFGGNGPLLEFVYLVTQGALLRERLQEQVRRLEDEVESGILSRGTLELLRIVSVASAYEASLSTERLLTAVDMRAPRRVLEKLEEEYLIRLSGDDELVEGLHPIRSAILADLLIDPAASPWSVVAAKCLLLVRVEDVEGFLLYAFSQRRREIGLLLDALNVYHPNTWVGIASVLHALLWLGLSEYVAENRELIDDAFKDSGLGWYIFLDWDIADVSPDAVTEMWNLCEKMLDEARLEQVRVLRDRQTDKERVYSRVRAWLSSRIKEPSAPSSNTEWRAMAETLFWVGRFGILWPLEEWMPLEILDRSADSLPLPVLADVVFGFYNGYGDSFRVWLDDNRARLKARFREDTQTLVLEDDGSKLTAHFVIPIDQEDAQTDQEMAESRNNPIHDEAMQRITLLSKLFPDRREYACRGYGHNLWGAKLPLDDSVKTGVAGWRLPTPWLTSLNSTFRGLGERQFRPVFWPEYAESVFNLRREVINGLLKLERALATYFGTRAFTQIINNLVTHSQLNNYRLKLRAGSLLPTAAVDEWGILDESIDPSYVQQIHIQSRGLAITSYRPLLEPLREYRTALENFFGACVHALILNPSIGRGSGTAAEREAQELAIQQGLNPDAVRLSVINFADAVKALPRFQREFRSLLGQYFDEDQLLALEQEESLVLKRVWSIWCFFAFQPEKYFSDASRQCPDQVTKVEERLKRTITRELGKVAPSGIAAISTFNSDILWDDLPAMWISIDVSDPSVMFMALGNVLEAIRAGVRRVETSELRRHVIEFEWPHLVIVPLVRGKALEQTAWRVYLPLVLGADDQTSVGWWNFVLKEVPEAVWDKLELRIWDDPGLEVAHRLLHSTVETSLIAAHIRDFREVPDVDEKGKELFHEYIESISGRISRVLQSACDAGAEMANSFNQMSEEDKERRPNLIEAMQAVIDMQEYLMPTPDTNGVVTISVEQIYEWADRLEAAREYAFLAYSAWVSEVLDAV